jgi:hypothetical protein
MRRRRFLTLIIFVVTFSFAVVYPIPPSAHAAASLPSLPSEAIRNAVIAASGGVAMVSLGIPTSVSTQLAKFTMAPFAGVTLDAFHVVHYIDTSRIDLQILIPRLDSRTTPLAPNAVTPDDAKPAMVVGGYYDWSYGIRMVVAVFKDTKPGTKPTEMRMYAISNTGTLSYLKTYVMKSLMFKGVSGQQSYGDVGALIATTKVCYALYLDQFCFESKPNVRDSSIASYVSTGKNAAANSYSFSANFNQSQAVPDLVGANYRNACKASVQAAANLLNALPTNCAPNIIVTANDHPTAGQPVALFVVLGANDMKTYSPQGAFVGSLPPGNYLVMDATPSNVSPTPGNISVFYLVNADTKNHFLLPNIFIEGFGDGILGSSLQMAAIKDGTTSGWGF